MTNDLKPDVTPIIKINDYKKFFNPFIKPKLDYCSEVRLIKFKKNSCKISPTLNEPKFTALNLFKNNFDSNSLIKRIDTIELAYGNFLPINRDKLYDINKLIEPIILPENVTFFQTLYSDEIAGDVSKTKKRLLNVLDKENA